MALPLPAAVALERTIEAVLRLDPESRERLGALEGKLVRFELSSPPLDVVIGVAGGRVFVPSVHDGEVDATVAGKLDALRSLVRSNDALYRGEVRIDGDLSVGMALREIATGLDLDPAEALAPVLGDALAHRLDRTGRAFAGWLSRSRGAMRENARDWFEDEAELVATAEEATRFAAGVDTVREDVDRLEARLRRLERAAGAADAGRAAPGASTRGVDALEHGGETPDA